MILVRRQGRSYQLAGREQVNAGMRLLATGAPWQISSTTGGSETLTRTLNKLQHIVIKFIIPAVITFAPYDTGKTYRFAVPLSRDKEVSLTLITALKK
jgi:hypothetical protein